MYRRWGNIGKTNGLQTINLKKRQVQCFEALYNYVDYFVVNVSSQIHQILGHPRKGTFDVIVTKFCNHGQKKNLEKPILQKIAP